MVHRKKKRKSLKPALKRSEENSMGTTETIWIGRLTNKHKLTIINIKQPICSDIMNLGCPVPRCQWITAN